MDYKLTDRDVLSNALSLNHRNSGDASVNAYDELDGSRATTSTYLRPKNMDASGWMLDYNLAFKRTFEQRKHEFSAEVRYNYADDNDAQYLWRQLVPAGMPLQTELEHDANSSLARSFTGQADYMKTFAPRTKLETDTRARRAGSTATIWSRRIRWGAGTFVNSPLSSAFSFDENVQAVYGVISQGVGKFDLQAGLRGEHAERSFNLAGAASYPYKYNSVYPSAVMLYNATQTTQLKASYSRRVRRPGTQELNPFVQYFDVQNVFIGNPALAPEYTDAFEGGVTKQMAHGNIQFSPFYRKTTDIIRVDINTTDTIAGREVTSISFRNLATSNSWGADMNGALRLGPKFNGFAGFNLAKVVTDGGSTSAVGSDAVTWFARVNGTSEVTQTLMLQGSFFYRAPMNIERGRFERMMMANFSVRKKLRGDKLSATLRANDPFNTGAVKVRVGDAKVIQVTQRSFSSRMYWLAFQYSYGRPPRVRQPKQDDQGGGSSGFTPPPQ